MLGRRRLNSAQTISVVCRGVWISGYLAAADSNVLAERGITHVLKLVDDNPDVPGGDVRLPGISYLVLPARDRADFDIAPLFAPALAFMYEAVRSGGNVLVHCHAGVSRSATVALMYLMTHCSMSLRRAWLLLRFRRPVVLPNVGFWRVLQLADSQLSQARRGAVITSGVTLGMSAGPARRPPSRLE